jgi:hypothetical protein
MYSSTILINMLFQLQHIYLLCPYKLKMFALPSNKQTNREMMNMTRFRAGRADQTKHRNETLYSNEVACSN